jgi:hypothetical protein
MTAARKNKDGYAKILREMADELGTLKALLAPMKLREDAIKDFFIESGYDRVEGEFFCVNVSRFPVTRLIKERVAAFLTAMQIKACSETKEEVRVTCNAHKD